MSPLQGRGSLIGPQEVGASPYPKYEPLSGALSPLYQPWFLWNFEHPTLQGAGTGNTAPRALPWAMNLLGFQPAQSRR